MRDLLHAVRSLRRAPAFAVVAILTLALGIGINTAVFSAAYAVFLSALPYPDAHRLMFVTGTHPGGSFATIRYSDYEAIQRHVNALEAVSAFQLNKGTLLLLGDVTEPVMVRGNFVTPSHLELQDARPVVGRIFRADENVPGGGSPVALLSHAAWQLHFGGDAQILGRVVQLNRQPVTVIGVLPANFKDVAENGAAPDVWLPAHSLTTLLGRGSIVQRRGFSGIGRLRKGVWVMNADGSERRNLTRGNRRNDWGPAFSPDGRSIIFLSGLNNIYDIYAMNADGSNVRRITHWTASRK